MLDWTIQAWCVLVWISTSAHFAVLRKLMLPVTPDGWKIIPSWELLNTNYDSSFPGRQLPFVLLDETSSYIIGTWLTTTQLTNKKKCNKPLVTILMIDWMRRTHTWPYSVGAAGHIKAEIENWLLSITTEGWNKPDRGFQTIRLIIVTRWGWHLKSASPSLCF